MQQIIDVPLGLFVFPQVAVQSGLEAAQSRADIDVVADREIDRTKTAHIKNLPLRQLDEQKIASLHRRALEPAETNRDFVSPPGKNSGKHHEHNHQPG